jgi:hypothetical protein
MERASIQALYLPSIVTFTVGSRDKVRTSSGYRNFRGLPGKGLGIAAQQPQSPEQCSRRQTKTSL